MECKATLNGVSRDFLSGKWLLTFSTEENITGALDAITGKDLSLRTALYRKKRSLDANAYYWVLLGKMAEKLRISTARAHNIMLSRNAYQEIYDGQVVYITLPDTDEAAEKAIEATTFHIRPTSRVWVRDGMTVRDYELLRGSHTFDTNEMARLIDDLVDECKHLGIETMPPEQLAQMMAVYEETWRKKHENSVTE